MISIRQKMLSFGFPWGLSVEHGQLERRPSCYVIIVIDNELITSRQQIDAYSVWIKDFVES